MVKEMGRWYVNLGVGEDARRVFEELARGEGTSAARALSRYVEQCVEAGRIVGAGADDGVAVRRAGAGVAVGSGVGAVAVYGPEYNERLARVEMYELEKREAVMYAEMEERERKEEKARERHARYEADKARKERERAEMEEARRRIEEEMRERWRGEI